LIFVLSLAGVPPFSGFLSKLLMINGIVHATAGSGSLTSGFVLSWAGSVEIAFWLAFAVVINSALSLFYYLRIGLVMFFEDSEEELDSAGTPLRVAIAVCALLTIALGIGPLSQVALELVGDAALDILSS